MADMPERIRIKKRLTGGHFVLGKNDRLAQYGSPTSAPTEYVRADLLAARDAEIAALKLAGARLETHAERWHNHRAAATGIRAHGYGCPSDMEPAANAPCTCGSAADIAMAERDLADWRALVLTGGQRA